ncbi:hypothetical protein MMC12_006558 [Toensbergia leucococca]|nr:hypothetical protein [Toensbergia leucococca]
MQALETLLPNFASGSPNADAPFPSRTSSTFLTAQSKALISQPARLDFTDASPRGKVVRLSLFRRCEASSVTSYITGGPNAGTTIFLECATGPSDGEGTSGSDDYTAVLVLSLVVGVLGLPVLWLVYKRPSRYCKGRLKLSNQTKSRPQRPQGMNETAEIVTNDDAHERVVHPPPNDVVNRRLSAPSGGAEPAPPTAGVESHTGQSRAGDEEVSQESLALRFPSDESEDLEIKSVHDTMSRQSHGADETHTVNLEWLEDLPLRERAGGHVGMTETNGDENGQKRGNRTTGKQSGKKHSLPPDLDKVGETEASRALGDDATTRTHTRERWSYRPPSENIVAVPDRDRRPYYPRESRAVDILAQQTESNVIGRW